MSSGSLPVDIIQDLCASGVDFCLTVRTHPECGFSIELGSPRSGFTCSAGLLSWADTQDWLIDAMRDHCPDNPFVDRYKGVTTRGTYRRMRAARRDDEGSGAAGGTGAADGATEGAFSAEPETS